jgi:putative phosphoribosyl transferase
MIFLNREDAGRRLAAALMKFKGERPCILALPRGGVPVAFEVAKALGAPLDLVLVRKIGAPFQPELAIAAVVDGKRPELVVNEDLVEELGIDDEFIAREETRQLKEIERRRQSYLAGRDRLNVEGRTAIIIDDGIATGATVRAAIHATRRAKPKRIVVAAPVAPIETAAMLRSEADEVVCLGEYEDFGAIGFYYRDFHQIEDDEVRDFIARAIPLPETKTA